MVGEDRGTDVGGDIATGDVDFSGIGGDLDPGADLGELDVGNEAPEGTQSSPSETLPAEAKTPPPAPPAPAAKPDGEGAKPGQTSATPEPPSSTTPKPGEVPSPSKPDEKAAQPETKPAQAPQSELEAFTSDLLTNEAAYVEKLAKEDFALSPEMVQALADGDGANQIPKIVATAYVRAVRSAVNVVQKTASQMIQREVAKITEEQALRQQAETMFFAKWPQLTREKHFTDIQAVSHALYSANPKMTPDELIALTGAAVMAKHGIVAQAAVPPPPGSNGAKPGFVPAAAGRVVSREPVEANQFAGMGGDFSDS